MPPRDRSGRPQDLVAGTAVITGTVVDAETGQPLRRTSVQAFLSTPPSAGRGGPRSFVARTDDAGAFTLRDLPAGTYNVRAQRGGYVPQSYGQSTPNGPPRRLTVEDRARLTGIDFRLQPGGVIAGRVTDDAGEPAEGVMVRVLTGRRINGRMRYVPSGGRPATTDDLGSFRIYGLAPGEYIVAADPSSGRMFMASPTERPGPEAVDTVTTYAPGTPAAGEAERVRVVAGQVASTDIQLVAAQVVTVSGRVVDSTGKPLEGGMVSLRADNAEVMAGGVSGRGVMPDGSFSVPGVTPGAYTLHVMGSPVRGGSGAMDVSSIESAAMPLVVGGEPLDNLTVTTSPPSLAKGRVVVDGDGSSLDLSGVQVFARPVEPDGMMMGGMIPARVQDDRTVTVNGLRGEVALTVAGLPRGWWVKALRVNGQDAIDGFDFGVGRTWTGLEIVVNDRPASVGGQVVAGEGQPTPDFLVLVFPQDFEARAQLRSPGVVGLGSPDQHGGFLIEHMRPGDYFVVAVAPGQTDGSVFDDPDALRDLSQRAEAVTIREGQPHFLTLKRVEP